MAQLLIRWGANVEAKDEYRRSAVDYAVTLASSGVGDALWLLLANLNEDLRPSTANHDWLML